MKVGPVAIIDEKVCHSLISDAESATLMPPLSSWLMVGEWELERFPHENREGRQAAWTETKGAFNGAGSVRIHCWTWRGSGVTARSHGDSAPFGEHWGRSWLSTAGAGRSSEVSPPHNVTNPSGMTTLHTPAHPLPPTILDNWVKTPAWALPQARTETPTPPVAASRPITSHIGCSALSPSSLFFSHASGFFCSFCVYRTFTRVSPRHTPHVTPPSMATLPGARRSLRLDLEKRCDTLPTTHRILLYWWKKLSKQLKIFMHFKKWKGFF